MNTDSLNIMNLMLGSLPQTTDLASIGGLKSDGEIQNTGFDLIFDQLLMSLGETETLGEKQDLLGLNSENIGDALVKNVGNALVKNVGITDLYNTDESPGLNTVVDNPENVDENIISGKNNELLNSLQQKSQFNNLTPDALSSQSLNPDGKFKVKSWDIVGDKVNFELVSDKNPDSVIKVSLPTEKIAEQLINNPKLNSTLNRIPLDGQKIVTSTQLEELLTKYDIKELQFSNTENLPDKTSGRNVLDVEIFAQNAGQEIVLKSKLSKNVIQVTTDKTNVKLLSADNKASEIDLESGQSKFASVKQNTQNTLLNMTLKANVTDKFNLMKEFTESGSQNSAKADQVSPLPDFIKSSTEITLTKDKVDLQPVRFTLPDNINAQLKLGGKSVRINIEPDNLGPARLSLNMHNDKLRAVVTVHSAQAKMTVEGSLDKLLDTLNKADIQVDYIDVDVNQQNSYEQFAKNRPNYFRQQNNSNFSLEDYLTNESSQIENITPRGVSYVHANGVNLTA